MGIFWRKVPNRVRDAFMIASISSPAVVTSPVRRRGTSSAARSRSARIRADSPSVWGRTMTNSSPPNRQTVSLGRQIDRTRSAMAEVTRHHG